MKAFAIAAISIVATSAFAASLPTVGELEIGTDYDTPTCDVGVEGKSAIFAAPYDLQPMMKLDGRLVSFKLATGATDLWDYQKQDQAIDTTYVSEEGLSLRIQGQIDDACEADEEGCEYVTMKVKATLTNGEETRVMENLVGGCGV